MTTLDDRAVMLARAQAGYYLISGVWPLVHLRSFEVITGAKTDRWLVKTVGGLVTGMGAGLALASARRRLPPELILAASGNAAALAAVDVIYVARRRISPIYLLDALPELGFVAGWAFWWWQAGRATSSRGNA